MAEFIYTTSTTISGPWLIDSDKLEALDKIFEEELERITKRNEELIRAEVEQRLKTDTVTALISLTDDESRRNAELDRWKKEIEAMIRSSYRYRDERSVTIYLKSNKRIVLKSFGEAMRQPDLIAEMPIGFDSVLQTGNIKGQVELRQSGKLDITVSPEHLAESRELFASLQRWATISRPPKWQQVWVSLNPLQWVLWIIVVLIGSTALVGSESAAKSFYKEQAKQLLQNGLSPDEQLKAIETLLALESGYTPPSQVVGFPGWFILLFWGGLIACIVLTITPKPRIGIGKGHDAINHWRLWMRIVFIIIPGFVFVNIIWPYLSRLFPSIF